MSPAERPGRMSRRRFLVAAGAGALAAMLQACRAQPTVPPSQADPPPGVGSGDPPAAAPRALPATPACGEQHETTLAQTEGPYFTPNSPERTSLREGGAGTPLVLAGAVLRTDCAPVARALVDVWHADAAGEYDNEGFRFRGHLFTDADGRYRLDTIVPGLYPGRTRHLHVKVQPPGGRVLTTQLYFPDEPANRRDGLFRPELNMAIRESGGTVDAIFDFVLEA